MIAAVGRAKAGPERSLYDHYASRLTPAPLLREVEVKKPLPLPRRREEEGALLLAQVPAGARLIVLDERGQSLGSEDLARTIADWASLACVIGGADGHTEAVRAKADLVLSLGRLTWPHMLVRGLLAEQLYRARCILDGHPYHRT